MNRDSDLILIAHCPSCQRQLSEDDIKKKKCPVCHRLFNYNEILFVAQQKSEIEKLVNQFRNMSEETGKILVAQIAKGLQRIGLEKISDASLEQLIEIHKDVKNGLEKQG
jgi:hypothetical protein